MHHHCLSCSQHEKRNAAPRDWVHVRKLWEDDETVTSSQVHHCCSVVCHMSQEMPAATGGGASQSDIMLLQANHCRQLSKSVRSQQVNNCMLVHLQ